MRNPYYLLLLFTVSWLTVASSKIDVTKYGLTKEEILKSPHYKDKVFNVEMSTESGEELLEHWAVQGFSGVVAAIATRRLALVEEHQQRAHQKCASGAETLAEHAKCLLQLERDAHFNVLRKRRKFFNRKMRKRIRDRKIKFDGSLNKKKRVKREIRVKQSKGYNLKDKNDMSPFGIITNQLANTLRTIKNKKSNSKWKDTISRISEKAQRIKKQKEIERFIQKRTQMFSEGAESLKSVRTDKELTELEKYIEDDDLKAMVRKKAGNMTEQDKMMLIPMRLIRSAAKLGLTMTGYNTTDFDRKIVRMFSPRIMSVLPPSDEAKKEEIEILSPSLFALHDEGSEVPKDLLGNLLESAKLENKAGIDSERGPEGQPIYFTKENVTERYPQEARRIEMFEALDKTFSMDQLREMNRTGYTIMRHDQMELIYGNGSVAENRRFLETAKKLSRPQIDRQIMGTIEDLARERVKFEARKNDIVLSPVVLTNFVFNPVAVSQPTILSPILIVSLIGSPAIYGVMILSPWVMVPVIISPRIFSPVVLNPFVMVPIILSPLAFNPFILCPGTMNPFVLSPLVFSPFILSPQVMTPLILTPFCLGPIILNPLALNPLILSPFVLSPTILSPQYVSAVILSPYALSPNFHSDGALVTVFASPSWLS